ncbi:MAG: hypothetical protein KatS3mg057_3106 [Herpetosiphonaceae bacterium]|nr:MAG: hypothetical protein KatS3mg057_3106 [Herpetosiphonaceae bacterium]
MVKGKGAALLALGLAGAAYFFRNKQQVKHTVEEITNRAQEKLRERRQPADLQRSQHVGDWSRRDIDQDPLGQVR